MHCHLFVPDFFRFDDAAEAAPRLAAAETLIAKGRRKEYPFESPEAWLCERFGVQRQRDWPVAPYTLIADGGVPGGNYWLRADPVHLQIDRDRLVLADDSVFSVSREEAEQLAGGLNAQFRDRLMFYPMQPERWYARLDAAPDLATVPLGAARGKSIEENLPAAGDSMRFHAYMNEAQMLLFSHPVNAAREARGEPLVNSIWFWGGGTVDETADAPFTHVLADDPLGRGLAKSAGVPVRALPFAGWAWLESAPEAGVALIVIDSLRRPASYADAKTFFERRQALEDNWFAPLLAALRAGRIGMITLHLAGPHAVLQVEAVRADLRHFWRLRKPLATIRP